VYDSVADQAGNPLDGDGDSFVRGDYSTSFSVLLGGDATVDGCVDVFDLAVLANNYGRTDARWAMADFNGDRAVDVFDLAILANNYGRCVGGASLTSVAMQESNSLPFVEPAVDASAGADAASIARVLDSTGAGGTYDAAGGVEATDPAAASPITSLLRLAWPQVAAETAALGRDDTAGTVALSEAAEPPDPGVTVDLLAGPDLSALPVAQV